MNVHSVGATMQQANYEKAYHAYMCTVRLAVQWEPGSTVGAERYSGNPATQWEPDNLM